MTVAVVEICNRALDMVGSNTITSLDDPVKGARLCRRLFPQLRDDLLREADYAFASLRAALPALSTAPVWGFNQAYLLPTDCVKLREINANATEGWRVEGNTIATNVAAPLQIRYTASIDASLFDPLFVTMLALHIGIDLAMPLANSDRLRAMLQQDFARARQAARGITLADAWLPDSDTTWTQARI